MSSSALTIVWGASGHARVVADVLASRGDLEVAAFYVDAELHDGVDRILGVPVITDWQQVEALRRQGVSSVIVAVGECASRLRLARRVLESGFALGTAVHARAVVADDVKIGAGTVVAAGAVINPGARVGANSIINTSASVDHDCILEEGVHVGPGAHLGGGVRVGRATWIGIGASIRDHVVIGGNTVIGMGAAVTCNLPADVVAYGVPARVVEERLPHDAEATT